MPAPIDRITEVTRRAINTVVSLPICGIIIAKARVESIIIVSDSIISNFLE